MSRSAFTAQSNYENMTADVNYRGEAMAAFWIPRFRLRILVTAVNNYLLKDDHTSHSSHPFMVTIIIFSGGKEFGLKRLPSRVLAKAAPRSSACPALSWGILKGDIYEQISAVRLFGNWLARRYVLLRVFGRSRDALRRAGR